PLGVVLRMPVLPALVPGRATSFGIEWINQQDALQRFTGHDESRYAVEIAARLVFGVRGASGRQRLEVRASASRLTGGATGVAVEGRRQDCLNLRLESVVIQPRRGRCRGRCRLCPHPALTLLPLGVVL